MAGTLSKEERLSRRSDIARLLSEGRYGDAGCVRYCFAGGGEKPFSRVLLSVRKRDFKRAVWRNLIRRRLRESYRLQKDILEGFPADIMLVYTSKEILPYTEIFSSVGSALSAIRKRLKKSHGGHLKEEK